MNIFSATETDPIDAPGQSPDIDTDIAAQPRDVLAKLTQILRWVGGSLLAVAALCFLFNGIQEYKDTERFWHFLFFNGLLSAIGLFCITRLKDDKGARTFMAIATAFLPVHFAHVGGMLHAGEFGQHVQNLSWLQAVMANPAAVLTGLILAATAIAYIGFSALARPVSKPLSFSYIAGNALLFFTFREPTLVALTAILATAGLVALDCQRISKPLIMRSWEGACVRSMLFAPVIILVTRNFISGDVDGILQATITAAMSFVLLVGPRQMRVKPLASIIEFAAFPMAFASYCCFLSEFVNHLHQIDIIPVLIAPCALIALGMSYATRGSGQKYRVAAITALTLSLGLQMVYFETILSSLCLLALTSGMVVWGYTREKRSVFQFGIYGMAISIGYQLYFAIVHIDLVLGTWAKLGIAGTATVLAASYLERRGALAVRKVKNLHHAMQQWS